jgi:hypothetical protein
MDINNLQQRQPAKYIFFRIDAASLHEQLSSGESATTNPSVLTFTSNSAVRLAATSGSQSAQFPLCLSQAL